MGNTGSTNSNQDVKQQYSFYDQELNEYKRMIIAQQEQINQLSNMNIKQNIKSRQTSNMFFNEIPDQQQINQQKQFNSYPRLNSQFNTINTNLIENNKPKRELEKIRNKEEIKLTTSIPWESQFGQNEQENKIKQNPGFYKETQPKIENNKTNLALLIFT